jgi:hypothetical protein
VIVWITKLIERPHPHSVVGAHRCQLSRDRTRSLGAVVWGATCGLPHPVVDILWKGDVVLSGIRTPRTDITIRSAGGVTSHIDHNRVAVPRARGRATAIGGKVDDVPWEYSVEPPGLAPI